MVTEDDLRTALGRVLERTSLEGPFARYEGKVRDCYTTPDGRRLLVEVVSGTERIGRKSPQIAQILRALQEDASEKDRVVLVANLFADKPVNSRPDDQVTVDALRLIQGLGANFIPTTSLFRIWKASLADVGQAQRTIVNLHSMDGGIFR